MANASSPEDDFPPRVSAFGDWSGLERDGVWIKPVERGGICVMTARKTQADALKQNMRTLYGIEPPTGPECVSNGETLLIATAPDTWLVMRANAERTLAAELRRQFAGLASVTDQSGAYAQLRIGGPQAAAFLQKGVFIDLETFKPSAAATTHIAHLGLILWQADVDQTYDLALFRSSARDFIHWAENA
jgi:sarcosine oxidase subunit gamma